MSLISFKDFTLILVSFFILFSCSSDESEKNKSKEVQKTVLSGSVVDGEIAEATVELVSLTDENDKLKISVKTDEEGKFKIVLKEGDLPSGKKIEDYKFLVSGGYDISSGKVQGSVQMSKPIERLESKQFVTPVSSMLADEMKEEDIGLEQAKENIKDYLGLEDKSDAVGNPLAKKSLLRTTQVLNKT